MVMEVLEKCVEMEQDVLLDMLMLITLQRKI